MFLKAIAKDTGVIRGGKGCNIPGAYLGEDSLNPILVSDDMADKMNEAIKSGLHKTWYIEWSD